MICPYCQNEVKDGAIKCQFCQEFLDEKARPKKFYGTNKVRSFQRNPRIYCPNCGYEGRATTQRDGSTIVELLLWLFILPGFIYTCWRGANRYYVCPKCGNKQVARQ